MLGKPEIPKKPVMNTPIKTPATTTAAAVEEKDIPSGIDEGIKEIRHTTETPKHKDQEEEGELSEDAQSSDEAPRITMIMTTSVTKENITHEWHDWSLI